MKEPPTITIDANGTTVVCTVNMIELTIRICEACHNIRRPKGASARQALEAMDDDCAEGWMRAAQAAMLYIHECLNEGRPVS